MRCSLQSFALTLSALAIPCVALQATAQTQPTFSIHTLYNNPNGALHPIAHGDFNNDGREDFIVAQDNQQFTNSVLLFLSNGDGTYDAPITLNSPAGQAPYVVGDFNHDGNLDYAVLDKAGKTIDLYQGHGDGTFTGGMYLATGQNPVALIAADLNHDNCTDLVVVATPGSYSNLQTWLSTCGTNVNFKAGQQITSGLINPSNGTGAFTGDFDGDGRADLALFAGSSSGTTVQVWYGDGKGNLGSPTKLTDTAGQDNASSVGDYDSNGTTDLLVTRGAGLGIFRGNTDRTLTFIALSTPSGDCVNHVETADINGDGINDLVYDEAPCAPYSSSRVVTILANSPANFSGSEDIIQSNPYWTSGFEIVKSTQGTRPDIVNFPNTSQSQADFYPPGEVQLLQNTTTGTSFPSCGTTNQAVGINVCSPPGSTANSPVQFSISASGPTPMRAVNVWVDGHKMAEQLTHAFSNYSFLDQSVTLSAGTHTIGIFGTGWDGSLQQKKYTLTVGGASGCGAPSTAGINVCKPVSGSTVGSPVEVQATATITGTLAAMEVWVDGVKKYTESSSTTLDTSIPLPNGNHKFGFFAVNTAGQKWNKVVYATVGSGTGCAAPSSYGVNVCSPSNGSTVSSPVQITATANVPGTLARMEVWANGVKEYTETSSTQLSTSLSLPAGSYRFGIFAVNTQGTKYETVVNATVK